MNARQRRHLLTQFTNAFAKDTMFLFLLANQVQRAKALQGVSLRVKNNPASFAEFEEMVNNKEAFIAQLRYAQEHPTERSSLDLLKKILRTMTCVGKHIPWSAEERTSELTYLYANWHFLGHRLVCLRLL